MGENPITFLTWFKDLSKKLIEPHKTIKKTTKACHNGILKTPISYDFGVFSTYFKLNYIYLLKAPTLFENILKVIAKRITPKNLRTASKPLGTSSFSIITSDFNTA